MNPEDEEFRGQASSSVAQYNQEINFKWAHKQPTVLDVKRMIDLLTHEAHRLSVQLGLHQEIAR